MAEIVRLNTKMKAVRAHVSEDGKAPFQLLFFTGVQYERNCTWPTASNVLDGTNKRSPKSKPRKIQAL